MNRAIAFVISAWRRMWRWAGRHRRLRPALSFLRRHIPETIAVVALVGLILGVNPPKLLQVFRHITWQLALLMVPVVLGLYLCRGMAWWVTLRKIGVHISIRRCLAIELAGQVMVFLPLGDLARVVMVRNTEGERGAGAVTGTVAFQELIYMMLLGFGVLPRVVAQPDIGALVLIMALLHVGIFVVLVWEPAYNRAVRVVERVRILRRFDRQLRELRPAFVRLFAWDTAVPVFLLQGMAAMLSFLLFFMALHAIGATQITFITATFLLGLSYILAGMSLVPGGLGAFEGLLTLLMLANGVPAATGAAAGLLYRGYNDVLMGLIGTPFGVHIRRTAARRRSVKRRGRRRAPRPSRA